jgi:hypothetical protein
MSQQGVPMFTWSDNALKVRAFLYDFWCTHGRGPNMRDTHEAVGLSREDIIAAYKELNFGEIVFDLTTQNVCMIKVPPFSAVVTQVQIWLDGRFFAYCGCAMESVACSRSPKFSDRDVRIESYCACCLAPITVDMRNGELRRASPENPLIHVSMHPDDWAIPNVWRMCDSMNYVVDADHAARYEAKISRRGVLFTIEQARPFVKSVADNRMWDYHWYPGPLDPTAIVPRVKDLGVDTSSWEPAAN